MRLIAHRGASLDAPENTLRAFHLAMVQADGLECDIQLSADGVPFVFHDDGLERLTGFTARVATTPASTLDALTVSGERIPRLAELAHLPCPAGFLLNLEFKPHRRPEALLAAVPTLTTLAERTELVISSFDPRIIALFEALPTCPARLAFLFDAPLMLGALDFLRDPDGIDLHPRSDLVTAEHLERWHRPRRHIRTWTVDDPDEARRILALDPEIALITNRPASLRAALIPSASTKDRQ